MPFFGLSAPADSDGRKYANKNSPARTRPKKLEVLFVCRADRTVIAESANKTGCWRELVPANLIGDDQDPGLKGFKV